MNKYVIIGNGISSVGCIEGIRSVDKEGSITVIAREPYATYARPLISYYLEGMTDTERMKYRDDDFYQKNNVEVYYGTTATSIDQGTRKIFLEGEGAPEYVEYDKLCIATGSDPFVPPFEGLDTVPKKHSFITLDDALELEKDIDAESNVLIVGAGLIGLKCAEGLAHRVGHITVCDLADRVLSSILDNRLAAKMQKVLEAEGIEFMLGNSVKTFDGNRATMNDGTLVDFDVLVLAVGVKANTALASEIGCDVNRGIVVDSHLQTSVENVWAVGDCSEGYDMSLGANRVLAILPNAFMQGECAGQNMAGADASFDNAIPMNSIGFFGFHAMSAGSYVTEEDGGQVYEQSNGDNIKQFFVKDNKLMGYMLVGDVTRGGIYTSLIRNQTDLDSVDFDYMMKASSLAGFDKKVRQEKLATQV